MARAENRNWKIENRNWKLGKDTAAIHGHWVAVFYFLFSIF